MRDWILDLGASFHVSPHTKVFVKKTCEILGVGDVQLKSQNGSTLVLKNISYHKQKLN